MNLLFIIIMVFCATVHLISMIVVAMFAHRRVQYLPLAWVLGLITASLTTCLLLFYDSGEVTDLGMIHPGIVLPMASSTYLETIYPLGMVMPGFLQWKRSVKYALPVLILVVGYFIGVMIVGHAPILHTFGDISDNLLLVPDVIIRLFALALSVYYVIGIVMLPKRMLKSHSAIPTYLKGYCTWLGLTYIAFIALSFSFHWWLLYVVLLGITANNLMFMLHSLEVIAESLPRPKIEVVTDEPEPVVNEEAERDFNEANQARFRRTEHYMQTTKEWTDVGFTRDRICEAVGFNRHLLLQCLRSQGYNNVHDYITTYRVEELRRIIATQPDDSLTQVCFNAGFSTLVTARNAYHKILGRKLDDDWNRESN